MIGLPGARARIRPCGGLAAIILLGSASVISAQGMRPALECRALGELTGFSYSILSATALAEDGNTSARCRVLGMLPPEIVFEVVLPDAWNGRILMSGNGGYAGTSPSAPHRVRRSDDVASRGFVSVYTNTGHDRVAEPLGSFALNNRQKEVDYGFRAVRLTIQTAKDLVRMYYGESPSYTYWQGCSTGGRQGLMAAQRFPGDFDGIVVGAPVLDFTGTQIWGAWNASALEPTALGLAKIAAVADAVYRRCDGLDGLEDGLLDDPRRCDFDPGRDLPRCSDTDAAGCFAADEIGALAKIYGGVMSRDKVLFPGLPFGSEAAPRSGRRRLSGWNGWIINEGGRSRQEVFAETFLRYLAFEPDEPDFDWRQFDFDSDPARIQFIRSILDATDPDLTRFRDSGGKMLMYFGWADTALNPMMGVEYYESVLGVTGEQTRDFFRLFMVPGMFHCGGGLGVSRADYLGAVMDWVESGKAPDYIVAERVVEGRTEMTRPLCPYPEVARYGGSGDPRSASSFVCRAPSQESLAGSAANPAGRIQ